MQPPTGQLGIYCDPFLAIIDTPSHSITFCEFNEEHQGYTKSFTERITPDVFNDFMKGTMKIRIPFYSVSPGRIELTEFELDIKKAKPLPHSPIQQS